VRRALTVSISGLVGAGLGALSGRLLFGGSAWNLIPWAIGSIVIGVIDDRRTALLASGIYGYLLTVAFLYTANTGNAPLAQRVGFALVLGLIGPIGSIILTIIGRLIFVRLRRRGSAGN
jgi:hypothetical protein